MTRVIVFLSVALLATAGCSQKKQEKPVPAPSVTGQPSKTPETTKTPEPSAVAQPATGLMAARVDKVSAKSFGDTVSGVETALKSKGFMVVAKIDHKNMLSILGVDMGGATTIDFGKPEMGKMLLPMDPALGLEMPGKIYVYEEGGAVKVSYYRPSSGFAAYPQHAAMLADMGKLMDDTYDQVTSEATGAASAGPAAQALARLADARVDKPSALAFGDTVAKVEKALKGNGFMVVAKIDHKNMLSMVGVDMGGATTIEFGKPDMGKMLLPMMPGAGLEMPGRIYVFEPAGQVTVSYVKPSVGFGAYGDPKLAEMGKMMDDAFDIVTTAATK